MYKRHNQEPALLYLFSTKPLSTKEDEKHIYVRYGTVYLYISKCSATFSLKIYGTGTSVKSGSKFGSEYGFEDYPVLNTQIILIRADPVSKYSYGMYRVTTLGNKLAHIDMLSEFNIVNN
jgi:hypothetical protein